ncbi:hypothetical protein K439DRAFT_517160 [Ramaria rubella]|nr:hypothetical protein K439DRAFT_517160 [Ramaria rubella]
MKWTQETRKGVMWQGPTLICMYVSPPSNRVLNKPKDSEARMSEPEPASAPRTRTKTQREEVADKIQYDKHPRSLACFGQGYLTTHNASGRGTTVTPTLPNPNSNPQIPIRAGRRFFSSMIRICMRRLRRHRGRRRPLDFAGVGMYIVTELGKKFMHESESPTVWGLRILAF